MSDESEDDVLVLDEVDEDRDRPPGVEYADAEGYISPFDEAVLKGEPINSSGVLSRPPPKAAAVLLLPDGGRICCDEFKTR